MADADAAAAADADAGALAAPAPAAEPTPVPPGLATTTPGTTAAAAAATTSPSTAGTATDAEQIRAEIEADVAAQREDPTRCARCSEPLALGETLLLPCLHTICRPCADRQVTATATLTCPVAACAAAVPDVRDLEGVDRLLPNLLRELALRAAVQRRCAACEDDVEASEAAATLLCITCEPHQPLCDVHGGLHRKRAATRSHELQLLTAVANSDLASPSTPLTAASSSDALAASASGGLAGSEGSAQSPASRATGRSRRGGAWSGLTCTRHPGKPLEAWCATCSETICLACTQADHRLPQHNTVLLDGVQLTQLLAELSQARTAAAKHREEAIRLTVDLRAAATAAKARTAQMHATLDRQVAAIRAVLDARAAALHRLIDDKGAADAQPVVAQLAALTAELVVADTPLQLAADIINAPAPPPLPIVATLVPVVRKRLDEIAARPLPARWAPPHTTFVFNTAPIEAAIAQSGRFSDHAVVDPGRCVASGEGLHAAQRGQDVEVLVTAYNNRGERMTVGGERVEVWFAPPARPADGSDAAAATPVAAGGRSEEPSAAAAAATAAKFTSAVVDVGNGTYKVHYKATADGRYQLHLLVNGQPIRGSPFALRVASFRDLSTLGPMPRAMVPMSDEITMCFLAEVPPRSPLATDLLITENSQHTVRVLSPDPRRGKPFGMGVLQSPYGVAVGLDGVSALVANGGKGRIDRFALPEGTFTGTVVGDLSVPVGVAVLADSGDLLISCSGDHTLRRVGADGALRWVVGTAGRPGKDAGAFHNPGGIAVSADGQSVFVADYSNHRVVQVATADGRWLRHWGEAGTAPGQLGGPMALAATPDGAHVLVVDQGNHRVQAHRVDTGACVHMWGGKGIAPGQFASPCGITVQPAGVVIVIDRFNKRLQFF